MRKKQKIYKKKQSQRSYKGFGFYNFADRLLYGIGLHR